MLESEEELNLALQESLEQHEYENIAMEEEEEECWIMKLPKQVLVGRILPYLTARDLCAFGCTCKYAWNLISNCESLWQPLLMDLGRQVYMAERLQHAESKQPPPSGTLPLPFSHYVSKPLFSSMFMAHGILSPASITNAPTLSSKHILQMTLELEAQRARIQEHVRVANEMQLHERSAMRLLQETLFHLNGAFEASSMETQRATARLEQVGQEFESLEHQEKYAEHLWEERFTRTRDALQQQVKLAEQRLLELSQFEKERENLEQQLQHVVHVNKVNELILSRLQQKSMETSHHHPPAIPPSSSETSRRSSTSSSEREHHRDTPSASSTVSRPSNTVKLISEINHKL